MANYKIGDIVFLITDKEQSPRMVTGILQRATYVTYLLSLAENETYHTEIEICNELNILTQIK